jgi:hypothetical protein
MTPKKPVPDVIRDGRRFSEKITREQRSWSRMTSHPALLRAMTPKGSAFATDFFVG